MWGKVWQFLRRWGLELGLVACAGNLGWMVLAGAMIEEPGVVPSQRNRDFPNTYIDRIHLDLTSPHHYVRLVWTGPGAAEQDSGPFHSSPGAGWGDNDCNDPVESNCPGSNCTPIGLRTVEGHLEHFRSHPESRYVTLIDAARAIGFHAAKFIPPYPASDGCVRLEPYAARLIYDNSITGKTEILIDGTWTNPGKRETNDVPAKGTTPSF